MAHHHLDVDRPGGIHHLVRDAQHASSLHQLLHLYHRRVRSQLGNLGLGQRYVRTDAGEEGGGALVGQHDRQCQFRLHAFPLPQNDGPKYLTANIANSCFVVGSIICTWILRFWLKRDNEKIRRSNEDAKLLYAY